MKKSLSIILTLIFMVAVASAFTKADPGYKNLKILPKDITGQQMDSVMNHFSQSLNVGCEFCHVKQTVNNNDDWDWASDKNKHKLVARDMMKMTNKLNDEYFPYSGKAENMSTILTVTCFTCHNGSKEPETRPKKKD
ncbi:MAG TPA: c-type cytochrome [Flavisolibacter sp.]|nr:c-type cytochrome [Flavisolibacter sp.]